MIPFFGKIRKKWLKQSASRKYFAYAIGEIVLIVIGILIALQINNWNESRKRKILEVTMLQEFKIGLQKDLDDINKNIWAHEKNSESAGIILHHLENDLPFHDSLTRHFAHAYLMTTFIHTTSPFETLKALGLDLITDSELRNEIIYLYDNRYPQMKLEESDLRSRYNFQINNILKSRFHAAYDLDYINRDSVGYLMPLEYESLKKDSEYIYFLRSNKNYTDKIFLRYRYYTLRERVQELINKLEVRQQ